MKTNLADDKQRVRGEGRHQKQTVFSDGEVHEHFKTTVTYNDDDAKTTTPLLKSTTKDAEEAASSNL
jgi:hypothetical protein